MHKDQAFGFVVLTGCCLAGFGVDYQKGALTALGVLIVALALAAVKANKNGK